MDFPLDPSGLLRRARSDAGLSQRDLADRAGTSQSVIARIETGVTDPTTGTLIRLLRACGAELRCRTEAAPVFDSHMLDDVERILALAPEARLEEVAMVERFLADARRV